ncbi:hypothetical protein Tco_0707709 [Tanacetum coccineum]|uniref:Retrotransposon gag domain-containing protein n=1 Tax=Tanacetum coccineum TaxID=301880 RepID=A0ABQ4YD90_9ASTR
MKKFKTPPDSPPITVIDPDDQPMWSSTGTVALMPSSAIIQLPVSNNFHIKEEAVMLRTFPFSLTGEAKTLMNELDEEAITLWNELREAFISRYFSPAKFRQMLRTCYGHGITKGTMIHTFYCGLDDPTQEILNAGGIFLYNTPNQAFKILEDKVLLKLDFSDDSQNPKPKTVASTGGSDINPDHAILMDKFKALTTKIDSEFLIIRKELNEM